MMDIIKFIINEEINNVLGNKNDIWYHGRGSTRPYKGNYIYITQDFDYATKYSNFKEVYAYKLNFGWDKVFTLDKLNLLSDYIHPQCIQSLENSAGNNGAFDWASIGCIAIDHPETEEELSTEETLEYFGYKAIELQERENIKSLLVFNQNNITLVDKINVQGYQPKYNPIGDN